jgi:hypothetical protein
MENGDELIRIYETLNLLLTQQKEFYKQQELLAESTKQLAESTDRVTDTQAHAIDELHRILRKHGDLIAFLGDQIIEIRKLLEKLPSND